MPNVDWIKDRPIAHRGYHDLNNQIWENTLSAFDRAISHGFAIECDLQLSSDDQPVVFHDDVLNRLCGQDGDVRQTPVNLLEGLAVGETKDTIPTFERMLHHVKGRSALVVELKKQAKEDAETFARSVLESLDGYAGHVGLMSFDHKIVKALSDLQSPFPVGLTAHEANDEGVEANKRALDMSLDFVSFHVSDLPSPFVEQIRARGLPVITWTVRDREAIDLTTKFADQMTFEGFNPDDLQV